MRNLLLTALALLPSCILISQDSSRYVHRGLFRVGATFTTGIFLDDALPASYFSGNLEYYFHPNVSFRGDAYYFLGNLSREEHFIFNHSVSAGISLHLPTRGHLDPYLIFQPGLAIAQSYETDPVWPTFFAHSTVSIDPLTTAGIGVNYYFQKAFHIFAETKYTYGKHFSNYPARSLSDIKFSFGLGFNCF